MTRRLLLSALAVAGTLATVAPAHAGTYTVSGTCGLWQPYSNNSARMAVYADGCRLVTRNTYGGFSSPQGTAGGWRMSAPAGAAIAAFSIKADLKGTKGWDAAVFANGLVFAVCPGGVNCVNANRTALNYSYGPLSTDAIVTRVRCYASSCTNTSAGGLEPERGKLFIYDSTMTVADGSPPAVRIIGGSAATGGWKRAGQQLVIDASDNVGIRRYEAFIDGRPVGVAPRLDCSDVGRPVPCPNGAGTVEVPLGGIADGTHTLTGRAIDSAGNPGDAVRRIAVDNTPPVSPRDVTVVGGAGWRTGNAFTVRWTNPVERFAAIARVRYELCPATVESTDSRVAAAARKRCVIAARTAQRINSLSLSVPGEGMWLLRRLWLEDAAGNQNAATAVRVPGLGFDGSPPTGVAFADEDPADPTRLNVRARDVASGIASGTVEARREGSEAWLPLPTAVTPSGLSATIADEHLPRGGYDLRAVAVNGAGLQQGSNRRTDGLPARVRLPLRSRSHLVAGRADSRSCRRVHSRHRVRVRRVCHRLLDATPRVRIGRSALLRGRLTVAGRPVRRQRLEVWSELLGRDGWKQLRAVNTSRTGRFRYRARRGPARTIRFRYPGDALTRGANAAVDLRVPASSSIRVSRRLVVTGEYVTFSGRLRGGWIPDDGTLVELQVYTRGAWRTFAQPRARRSGRWRYQYRFDTIRGRASFRFRARIRRQADYPFTTGTSRTTRVRVRGL